MTYPLPPYRPLNEVNEVIDWATQGEANGTQFPGMSYEEGVRAAIDWMAGNTDERPDDE